MDSTNLVEPKPTAAVERMRLHRQRRRTGLRWVRILLGPTQIEGLIRMGYLEDQFRSDQAAIQKAAELCISELCSSRDT